MEPWRLVLQRLQTAEHCLCLTVHWALIRGSFSPLWLACGLASWGWGWTDLDKLLNFHLPGHSQSPLLSPVPADGLFVETGPKPLRYRELQGK